MKRLLCLSMAVIACYEPNDALMSDASAELSIPYPARTPVREIDADVAPGDSLHACPSGTSVVRPPTCYAADSVCRDSSGQLCAVCASLERACLISPDRIRLYGCPGVVICYTSAKYCLSAHPLCE